MIALDQMANGNLTREEAIPLLSSADPAAARAAVHIVKARPSWAKQTVGLLRRWLDEGTANADGGNCCEACRRPSEPKRTCKNSSRRRSRGKDFAEPSIAVAGNDGPTSAGSSASGLDGGIGSLPRFRQRARIVRQAVACIRAGKVAAFTRPLLKLASAPARPAFPSRRSRRRAATQRSRIGALSIPLQLSRRRPTAAAPSRRGGRACPGALTSAQLKSLATRVAAAGPLETSRLVAAFEQSGDEAVGKALLANLEHSPGLASVTPGGLRNAGRRYPDDVRKAAAVLLKKIDVGAEEQKKHLTELQSLLSGGDAGKGRVVFLSARTACSACHTVNGQGGRVGPELSKIGSIRAPADLLESVVYPAPPSSPATKPILFRRKKAGP